jgi:hypothetical protein
VPQRRLAPRRPPRQRGRQHQARIARTGAVTAPRVRRSSTPAYRPPRHLGDRPLHACQNRPRHQARHTPGPLARGRDTDLRSPLRRSAQNATTEHRRPGRRHCAQIRASAPRSRGGQAADEPGHGGGVGGGDVPARGSLSAAIEGRRLARLTLDSQPQLQPEPAEQLDQADNDQAEDPPADPPARNAAEGHSTASGNEADPKAESGRAGTPPTAARDPQPASCSPAQATASCS